MLQTNINSDIDEIQLKCNTCNRHFKTIQSARRHKNRKSPCLMVDVAHEYKNDPNRCTFCNKIFTQHQSLNRHLKKCKVKSGELKTLNNKDYYKQEIKNLKTQLDLNREEIKRMQDRISNTEKQIKYLISANEMTRIVFNNYDTPRIDNIIFTQDDLLTDNTLLTIIKKIYFDKSRPWNHTIYLPNLKEDRLLIYTNGAWENVSGDNIEMIFIKLKNVAFIVGMDKINNKDIYVTEDDLTNMAPLAREALYSFNGMASHARCTNEKLKELILTNRELIAETLKMNKII